MGFREGMLTPPPELAHWGGGGACKLYTGEKRLSYTRKKILLKTEKLLEPHAAMGSSLMDNLFNIFGSHPNQTKPNEHA